VDVVGAEPREVERPPVSEVCAVVSLVPERAPIGIEGVGSAEDERGGEVEAPPGDAERPGFYRDESVAWRDVVGEMAEVRLVGGESRLRPRAGGEGRVRNGGGEGGEINGVGRTG